MSPSPSAAQHYAREGALTGRILSALTAAGKDLDRLTAEDLSPYDQFHSRGSQATAELAQLLDPQSGQRLLDLGCGIGGPAPRPAPGPRAGGVRLDIPAHLRRPPTLRRPRCRA